MAYFTLVLHDGETRTKRVLHIDGTMSVKTERQQIEAVERLPHRGTYLEQHGEGIATVTWEVFFGHDVRLVDNAPISGNEQFLQFRKQVWERWSELKSSSSRSIRENTKLEYHGWDRKEHFWCSVNVFGDPQNHSNPYHFEGTIVFKCYEPISGDKITVKRPDSRAVANKAKHDLKALTERMGKFNRTLRELPKGILDTINEQILKPIKQLVTAIEDFAKGITGIILFPASAMTTILDFAGTVTSRMGSILTYAVAQAANAIRNIRRTIMRLKNIPGAFKESLDQAGEDFKSALFELGDISDSDAEKARKRSGSNQDRLANSRALLFSATSSRKIRAIEGDTLQGIALRELGDSSRWREIAMLNDLSSSSEIVSGVEILIPGDSNSANGGRDSLSLSDISPEERFYGRDWRVFQNKWGKLQLARTGSYDTATVAGVPNCENAILTRVTIEQGTLPENAEYGFYSPIGEPQSANDMLMYTNSVERTVLQDPRFRSVVATVAIEGEGNHYKINQRVLLAGATGGHATQDVSRGL